MVVYLANTRYPNDSNMTDGLLSHPDNNIVYDICYNYCIEHPVGHFHENY